MISKTHESLLIQLLKVSSFISCVPWEYGGHKRFLITKKSLAKFHLNLALIFAYVTFIILRLPNTLNGKDSMQFFRVIIHLIAIVGTSGLIFITWPQFLVSRDDFIEHVNVTLLYCKKFGGIKIFNVLIKA